MVDNSDKGGGLVEASNGVVVSTTSPVQIEATKAGWYKERKIRKGYRPHMGSLTPSNTSILETAAVGMGQIGAKENG